MTPRPAPASLAITSALSLWLLLMTGLVVSNNLGLSEQELRLIASRFKDHAGEPAVKRLYGWQELLQTRHQGSERDKLERVNRFFNQLTFIDDINLWGEKDYWATPVEFLGAGGGDCEDFSIAKYFSLLELGVPDEKLRISYVKSTTLNQFHMVLAYYPTSTAEPLILDNINGEILLASRRPDLVPIYSFNGQELWLTKEKGRGVRAGDSSRLKLWSQLRERYRLEHIQFPQHRLD